ncbi:hypothetical protein AWB67_02228 [Caballeronia terrestris]|uniref:Uncharacterized protein n=1 Tax=Caballeronia terrestris TaxID=1226301 RepID=A0A158HXD6_9BURK|nr:hypothetical protein AWB67_02228 [Caballeronia terrestris]
MTSQKGHGRLRTASLYFVFAFGLTTAISTAFAVWQHFSPVPYWDSWDDTIGFYLRAQHDPWGAFFAQHNEHRLTVSRLIFYADMWYFHGRNVFSLIANWILAGILALAFIRVAVYRCATLTRAERAGVAGAALVFTYSWIQNENFTWAFDSQWFAVYLFALLAFHSIDRASVSAARDRYVDTRLWLLTGAASASVAAFSMASGVLVFPVLLVQAIYLRLKWRDIGAIAAIAAVVVFAFFVGWHAPASSGDLRTGLREHPLDALRFVLLYLGAPAWHARRGMLGAYVCGSIALVALIVFCVEALRRRRTPPRALSLLMFAGFVTSNAVVTAGGRLWFGLESALASRYTTASLGAWFALLAYGLLSDAPTRRRRAVFATGVVALVMVFGAQRFAFNADRNVTYARLVAGLALRAHVYDPDITGVVYPFHDALIETAKQAEAARISIFAADQPDYLEPPRQVVAQRLCTGAIDQIAKTGTAGIFRATGSIYDVDDRETPGAVVITDAAGHTLGTGVVGAERDDIRKIYGRRARYSGWTAFFSAPPGGAIVAIGQTGPQTWCRLEDSRDVATTVPQ